MARLEHVNVTVADPDKAAETLCALFDWKVRWAGPALTTGRLADLTMWIPPTGVVVEQGQLLPGLFDRTRLVRFSGCSSVPSVRT